MTGPKLEEAFGLLTAVDRPRDLREVVLKRDPAMTSADLTAADAAIGWALPAENRALLSAVGTFKLKEVGDIAEGEFLSPQVGREWLPKMKGALSELATLEGPETESSDLDDLPVDDLLAVVRTYDRDGRHACHVWRVTWLSSKFYGKERAAQNTC